MNSDLDATLRIGKPHSRLEHRVRKPFNAPAWWLIMLGLAALIYLGAGLGFSRERADRRVEVFGTVTEEMPMPWYYGRPWFGALVLAGLPAAAYAVLLVKLMETRHAATTLRAEMADLSLRVDHSAYALQDQLDAIARRLDPQRPVH